MVSEWNELGRCGREIQQKLQQLINRRLLAIPSERNKLCRVLSSRPVKG